jgi:nicotinamide-nucleotide amidase
MDLELVTIGTELLLGFTVDTNSAEIARSLAERGIRVVRRTSVGDTAGEIRDAVGAALRRTGAALTTGGLGPTRDDITKRTVAELLDAPLEFDQAVWSAVIARFQRLGRTPSASNRSQAEVPRGATVLPNRWGTAPGLWLETGAGLVVMLPGVPVEMRNLLAHEVVPRLIERAGGGRIGGGSVGGGRVIRSLVVRTTAIPESTLAERLGVTETAVAPLTLSYLPGLTGVDLRLTAWQTPADEADRRLRVGAQLLRERAGEHVYGEGDAELAEVVLDRMRTLGLTLGVAESCTGGLVGGRLTDVAGSSDVFAGGVIAYDNQVKITALGVLPELLAEHGAVSEPVVRAMAEGAVARLGTDAAIAVTGIAGPGGGSEEKPVGTVWLGVALGDEVETKHSLLFGNRAEIRARAVQLALFLLYRRLVTRGTGAARAAEKGPAGSS